VASASTEAALQRRARFLKAYEIKGREFNSFADFCRAQGTTAHHAYRWARAHPDFKAAIELIRQQWKAEGVTPEIAKDHKTAAERYPHLPEHQAIFLEVWRTSKSRVQGAKAVGHTWAEISDQMRESPEFQEAADTVEGEFLIEAEDAAMVDAIGGKGGQARTNLLEARSEKFSKIHARNRLSGARSSGHDLTNYDREQARAFALELYQRCVPPPIEPIEEPGADLSS